MAGDRGAVTREQVADALAQYKAGLHSGVGLLRRLETVAAAQRAHADARDYPRLAAAGEARAELTRALSALEPALQRSRALLVTVQEPWFAGRPDYEEVKALRETARQLVARVLAIDTASLRTLADADLAHRAAMAGLETGGHTLAAYRRALVPATPAAPRVSQRG